MASKLLNINIFLFLLLLFPLASCSDNDAIIKAYDSGHFDKASALCSKKAKSENASCLYLLGHMAYEGEGGLINRFKSAKLFAKSAALGHRNAQLMLGVQMVNGDGIKQALEEGLGHIKKAADLGLPAAQLLYYKLIMANSEITKEIKEKAASFLLAAAEGGNSEAQIMLASKYCVPSSTSALCSEKGLPMLNEAAKSGSISAFGPLGTIYYSRNEFDRAIAPLRNAALNGDKYCAFLLGRIYLVGGGYEKGYGLVKLAAEAKIKGAENQLEILDKSGKQGGMEKVIEEGKKFHAQLLKQIQNNELIAARKNSERNIRKLFLDKN